MLKITLPSIELFDEKTETFSTSPGVTLQLEHSLISLSKWEAKFCKAFLTKGEKTRQETIEYVKAMTLTQNVPDIVYLGITQEILSSIFEYIESPQTATHLYKDKNSPGNRETITSELIYYWMIALQIPFECQKWHLNRLLTLIEVVSKKNNPSGKKISKGEIRARNRALNEQRRAELGTRG